MLGNLKRNSLPGAGCGHQHGKSRIGNNDYHRTIRLHSGNKYTKVFKFSKEIYKFKQKNSSFLTINMCLENV